MGDEDGRAQSAGIRAARAGGTLLAAAGSGAKRLSIAAGAPRARLPAGLGGRHFRARARQRHGQNPRPAIRGREQARRRIEPRRGIRLPGRQGRLHFVPRLVRQHHQSGDLDPVVRHGQGFCTDRAGRYRRRRAGGASFDQGSQRAGADRAGEVEARRGALCLDRRRRRAASRRGIVFAARRREARARALSGQPAGGDRSRRRPHHDDVFAGLRGARPDRSRQPDRARFGRQQTPERAAQPADHGGSRHAGFRHQHLVRPDGARRHAGRRSSTSSRKP